MTCLNTVKSKIIFSLVKSTNLIHYNKKFIHTYTLNQEIYPGSNKLMKNYADQIEVLYSRIRSVRKSY
jgi:hypothetical protein